MTILAMYLAPDGVPEEVTTEYEKLTYYYYRTKTLFVRDPSIYLKSSEKAIEVRKL